MSTLNRESSVMGTPRLLVTDEAMKLIQQALVQSGVGDPVVSLVTQTDSFRVNPELGRAVLEGSDEQTLRRLAERLHGAELRGLQRRLLPEIYTRNQVPPTCLIEVAGVTFSFAAPIIEMMDSWVLDVRSDGLVLKDGNGAVVLPRSAEEN